MFYSQSLNGVFVDGKAVSRNEECNVSVGATVQFGQPATFVYHFGMKEISAKPGSTSNHHSMRTESEGDRLVRQII